jgi:hypothetical protein
VRGVQNHILREKGGMIITKESEAKEYRRILGEIFEASAFLNSGHHRRRRAGYCYYSFSEKSSKNSEAEKIGLEVSYMGRSHHGVVSNDFHVERMAREVAHFLLGKMKAHRSHNK